jgi:hypothetical protein
VEQLASPPRVRTCAAAITWWEEQTAGGGEGMAVKPRASGGCVGGLVGDNRETITGSQVVGTSIIASGEGAGFACSNEGTISGSASSAAVEGETKSAVSGFVGDNGGSIGLSYGSGTV